MLALLLVFVGAMLVAAHVIARSIWRLGDDEAGFESPSALERALATGLVALSITLTLAFSLALLGVLSAGSLVGAIVVAIAVGVFGLRKEGARIHNELTRTRRFGVHAPWIALASIALAIWIGFALWRGHVLFVLNHDGLAYHMPRAHLMAQSGRLGPFAGTDARITWPPAYELLLAITMLLGGDDTWSAWVGTASYLALLLAVAAIAHRWWGGGLIPLVAALLVASMPVVVLHASAHKNDLMATALTLTVIHFLVRWATGGGTPPFVFFLLALGALLGTKLTGFFVGAGCVVVFAAGVARARRNGALPRGRKAAIVVCGMLLSATLVGPVTYLFTLVKLGHVVVPLERSVPWGALRNIWEFAFLVFAKPFSGNSDTVHVPWTGEDWFWPDNNVFISSWGALATLALFAAPVVLWAQRRTGALGRGRDCAHSFFIAIASSAGIVALKYSPEGFFNCSVRYTLAVPALLLVWSAGGTLALATRAGHVWVQRAALVASVVLLGTNAWDLTRRDDYGSLGAFTLVLAHPELDRTVWSFPDRAASVVDRLAAPDAHIAADGEFDMWIYPAYGRERRRRVTVLPHASTVTIPDDVDWVIIDRTWSCFFGHPDFKSMGDWGKYIGRGAPRPEDLVVFRQVSSDPRFRLVYHLRQLNQAVFQRVRTR